MLIWNKNDDMPQDSLFFLSRLSKMQVLIWSTGLVLSDLFLMAEFTFLQIIWQYFVNFFPTLMGFLQGRLSDLLIDW